MKLVGAIDQGTSSSRFIIFKAMSTEVVAEHQVLVTSIYPQEGWVEQDPNHILDTVKESITQATKKMMEKGYSIDSLVSLGITNQRETTIVWDKITGEPLYNAIIWSDTRTKSVVDDILKKHNDPNILHHKCGLPVSTYFSALKLKWLLDNIPHVKEAMKEGRLLFGTVDSWLIYKLTMNSIHITDVSNASRTMLMNINTLEYDKELLNFFGISSSKILPKIKSSSEIYGTLKAPLILKGKKISGCLGDQQAALIGQGCISPGLVKSTYGTGCFLLMNVGKKPVFSKSGLLSTIGYKFGPLGEPVYALEGSIASGGSILSWMKDNLKMFSSFLEVNEILKHTNNTGDVYFVPAFSGLFAPYWRSDARGTIVGLTQFTKREHLIRSAVEAVCFQTKEILEAMQSESGICLESLLVDGGMCKNDGFLMILADILGLKVQSSSYEATALGAAIAAGHSVGIWNLDEFSERNFKTEEICPSMTQEARDKAFSRWKLAIDRSLGWVEK